VKTTGGRDESSKLSSSFWDIRARRRDASMKGAVDGALKGGVAGDYLGARAVSSPRHQKKKAKRMKKDTT